MGSSVRNLRPGEKPRNRLPSHVIRGLSKGTPVALSHGRQQRDLLYIDDAVAGLIRAAEIAEEQRLGPFNICTGHPVTIRSVSETIADRMGVSRALLQFDNQALRSNEQMWMVGDNRAFASASGWRPAVELEQGLDRLIETVRDQGVSEGLAGEADGTKADLDLRAGLERGGQHPAVLRPVSAVIGGLAGRYDFEFVFTDNHSSDRTFEILTELAQRDRRIRAIRFSRNFGFQRSILTNYRHARGVAAIQLDCDLQDPPEMIVDFLRHWEQGYQVVYGVRRRRPKEALWLRLARRAFYRLIDLLSEERLPHDAGGDFRWSATRSWNTCAGTTIRNPICAARSARSASGRSASPMTGRAQPGQKQVQSVLPARTRGRWALQPLDRAAAPGQPARPGSLFPGGPGRDILCDRPVLLCGELAVGLASSSILTLFSIGMNALFLGIIGEYVGRIFKAVKMAPVAVIESVVDADLAAESVKPEGSQP